MVRRLNPDFAGGHCDVMQAGVLVVLQNLLEIILEVAPEPNSLCFGDLERRSPVLLSVRSTKSHGDKAAVVLVGLTNGSGNIGYHTSDRM